MTVTNSMLLHYMQEADRQKRADDRMGEVYGGNADIVKLRCFKYYHPDQGSYLTDPEGRDRWLGPKASRIYAILHRASSSGTGRTTMTAIASEAMACTSTVSRTVVKLQAFGFFAIDVIRGRNGGIVVRRRTVGDRLKRYAVCAWDRLNRARLNVASSILGGSKGSSSTTTYKDATFTEHCDGRCSVLFDCTDMDKTPLPSSEASRAADQEAARAADFARATVREVRRLQVEEPDWDDYLDKVRASHGFN